MGKPDLLIPASQLRESYEWASRADSVRLCPSEDSKDEYIGVVLDLSPQKQAERALKEREERFRVLADSFLR